MKTTRRGFFSFLAGAAALVALPLRRRHEKFHVSPPPTRFEPGDIVTFYGTTGTKTYRIISVSGPDITAERWKD